VIKWQSSPSVGSPQMLGGASLGISKGSTNHDEEGRTQKQRDEYTCRACLVPKPSPSRSDHVQGSLGTASSRRVGCSVL